MCLTHPGQNLDETPALSRLVFAENAETLRRHGLCVIPMAPDRTPCVAGFQNWTKRPAASTIALWIEKYPDRNLAIVPGLSNVIVADSDDADEDEAVEELLGRTELMVQTRRGRHRYYRAPPNIRLPGDLRPYGLKVDLKAGRSIVIAPPSIHESGAIYRLDGCDWSALKKLPSPNIDALKRLLDKSPKQVTRRPARLRDGSRGQWINDRLCRHAPYCSSLDELLDKAQELNIDLPEMGYPSLDEQELVRRTQAVWRDVETGKLVPRGEWTGSGSKLSDDIDLLSRVDARRAPFAFVLLTKLRKEHAARSRRGETFAISPQAMSNGDVVPGWTRETYEKARNLLVETGLVVQVKAFQQSSRGRTAAQYALPHTRAAERVKHLGGGAAVDRSH